MFRQYYSPIFIFLWMNYSCKCQDLETFVAPIVDNNGAPLVAIVNSTHISLHIVRSIEMPLRKMINATIESKFDDNLKEDIVSCKVLRKVNDKFDALQQKMDEHIGDNRNQMTEVNQDIATLRKEMEDLKNLAKTVNDMNSRVALTACFQVANFYITAEKAIKFTNIKTSIGMTDLSAYKSTGTFICKVAGLYHVSAVMVSAVNYAAIRIYKNNEVIITTYNGRTDGFRKTSTSVFVKMLDVGDEITVRTASAQYIYEHSCFTIVKLN